MSESGSTSFVRMRTGPRPRPLFAAVQRIVEPGRHQTHDTVRGRPSINRAIGFVIG